MNASGFGAFCKYASIRFVQFGFGACCGKSNSLKSTGVEFFSSDVEKES